MYSVATVPLAIHLCSYLCIGAMHITHTHHSTSIHSTRALCHATHTHSTSINYNTQSSPPSPVRFADVMIYPCNTTGISGDDIYLEAKTNRSTSH